MFSRGKPKLLTALAAVLGIGLGSAGCQTSGGPYGPTMSGGGYDNVAPGNTTESPATAGRSGGGGYLPNSAQQSVQSSGGNGQPFMGNGQPFMGHGGGGGGGVQCADGGMNQIPTEINRVSMPPYTVAPPDILYIDAARLVPRPPYKIEPLEVLLIQVTDTLPNQPIAGPFVVSPEGAVSLGFGYGSVRVQGLNVEQIQTAIRQHLSNILRNPQVAVSVGLFRGQQQVRGEHLVSQDGTISLGTYGRIYVAGMTLNQVKAAIEQHLSKECVNPQVAVDVFAFNSKVYYVVFDGGGYGQQIYRLPITGNETVLDAISNLQGLPPVSSLYRMWVARPSPAGNPCDQVLPVDWNAIVKGGSTSTNYQLFPGDRVYVDADCLVKTDLWLAKVLAPVERLLGITLLGTTTVNTIRFPQNQGFIGP